MASVWQQENFIEVVQEVYERTGARGQDLREALREATMMHIVELTKDDSFMTAMAELPNLQDFTAEMLRQMVQPNH